jgi:colanic acid/amylovoran biosynthesis glycosyltransferase
MRVLHIIRKNTHLKASFIQNQILSHVDFEPHVIYCEERSAEWDGGFAKAINRQIQIYNLANIAGRIAKLRYKYIKVLSKKQVKRLFELVEMIKPDVIHLHYGTDAGIYLPLLSKFKIPKVVSFYGYECSGFPQRFFGYGKTYLKRRVFRYATHIFAMSEDMKIDLIAVGCPEEKVIVHYYGTDVNRFSTRQKYPEKKNINFLIISGLEPQKGHSFLLKSFAAARNQNKNIKLSIIGSGSLKNKLKKQIHHLCLSDVVSLPGPVVYGSDDHLARFSSNDVFVHPSVTDVNGDKEGIPGAIVEAMAAGLPVISTYHAGIPYIIENEKTGLLVNEWDINALSRTILKLASSSELRRKIGLAGQQYAMDQLNLHKKEKELEKIYQMLGA